jgi:hypothetical protein
MKDGPWGSIFKRRIRNSSEIVERSHSRKDKATAQAVKANAMTKRLFRGLRPVEPTPRRAVPCRSLRLHCRSMKHGKHMQLLKIDPHGVCYNPAVWPAGPIIKSLGRYSGFRL